MNGYEKAVELGISDSTDAEIAAIVSKLTAGPIALERVRTWLRENKLWVIGPDGIKGDLYSIYKSRVVVISDEQASQQDKANAQLVIDGLDEFHASVMESQAESIQTNTPTIALQVDGVLQLIVGEIPNGDAIVAEFYTLDGGLTWAGTTEADIAAQRAAYVPPSPEPSPQQTMVCLNKTGDVSQFVVRSSAGTAVHNTSTPQNSPAKLTAFFDSVQAALNTYLN